MIAAVVILIVLHAPSGVEVFVNPESITSMRPSRDGVVDDKKYFAAGVHCMINTSDGKFITVVETCADVRKVVEESKR